jgi:hypothetical protein
VGTNQFEASPDGRHLLVMQPPVQDSPGPTRVLNWLQELKNKK